MFKQKASFTLALLLLFTTLFACSEPSEAIDKPTVSDSGAAESVTETKPLDSLPAGLDFKGAKVSVRVDDNNHVTTGHALYFKGPEEVTGDVVYDTVIERNTAVEERLNVRFKFTTVSNFYAEVSEAVRTVVLAGDDLYHFMVEQQYGCAALTNEGMFVNAYDCKYFDFTRPWWWTDYMDATSIGADKSFFVAGDYFIDLLRISYITYFNKIVFDNNFGKSEKLYEDTLDGKWTLDALDKYAKEVYSDTNGNGKDDEGDLFGLPIARAVTDHFVYNTDVKFTSRDKNGIVRIDLDNARIASLAEKMRSIAHDNVGVYNYKDDAKLRDEQDALFMSGQALFIVSPISSLDKLRSMETDFGILPMPKFDEKQEKYKIMPHDTALTGVIPVTCQDLDITSAVIEALCSESHRTVMPTFFELALKIKYSRDEQSTRMIDLIHDSISTEFIYVYSSSLNNIGTIFREMYSNQSADYASSFAAKSAAAEAALASMIEQYKSIG